MNVAFSKPMTLAEFLDWEEQQPLRYEFDGFQPVAMTGGTAAHAYIRANIAASLRGRVRGKPCKYYGNDLKIEAAGHIRYPDGFVVCSPVANASTVVRDPVVIFEVLSPGTPSTDRIVNNQEYRATLSIQRISSWSRIESRLRSLPAQAASGAAGWSSTTRSCPCPRSGSRFLSPNSTKASPLASQGMSKKLGTQIMGTLHDHSGRGPRGALRVSYISRQSRAA